MQPPPADRACCAAARLLNALRQLLLHPLHHRPPLSIPHPLTLLFPPSSVSRLFCGVHPQRSRASCATAAWLTPLPPHAAAASPPLAGASGGSSGGGTYNTNVIGIGCILLPCFRSCTGGDCCGSPRRRRALAATSATPQHTQKIKRTARCPTLIAAHYAAHPPHCSRLAQNMLVVCSASNLLFVNRVVRDQNPTLGNCKSCFCNAPTAPTSFGCNFTISKRAKTNQGAICKRSCCFYFV